MTKATREDFNKTQLPTSAETGQGGKQSKQLETLDQSAPGIEMDRMAGKEAKDFLTPLCGPSQHLYPDSQSVIKSLPQDSSVSMSWSLMQSLQLCEALPPNVSTFPE